MLSTDQDHDTYYTRGNYRNYQQKPNPMNRPRGTTPAQGHHLTSIDNNIIEEEKNHVT